MSRVTLQNRRHTSTTAVALVSALALAVPASLCAQSEPSKRGDSKTDVDRTDIIVTGKRLGAGKSRATFELDKSDIADRPLGTDITLSLDKVPGAKVSTGDARGGSFSFEVFLRGLNKEQIGFTIDGIPTGDARFNGGSPPQRFIESSNVSGILVSQSAGDIGAPSRFALGGSIDFRTDEPSKQTSAIVEAGYGSDDYVREFFRVDTGELAHGLSAYGSFSHQANQNWAGPNARHARRDHFEFKMDKLFDNGAFLKAKLAYNDQFDNDYNIVTLPQFYANPQSDNLSDTLTAIPNKDAFYGGTFGGNRKDFLAYANGGISFGAHALLTVNPYYQSLRGHSLSYQNKDRLLSGGDPAAVLSYNATGGAVRPALITTSNPNVVGGPADMRVTPRNRDRYGVTSELKLTDTLPRSTIRLGGWWEGGLSTEDRNYYPILSSTFGLSWQPNPSYVLYRRSTRIETVMLYGQDSFAIIPNILRIDAGATWFNVHYTAKSPLEYAAQLSFSQHSQILPKIAFSLKPINHIEVFGGYARNFSGISEDAFLGSTALIAPGELKPLTTENFDGGIRFTLPHFALAVQAFDVRLNNNVGIVPNDPKVTDPFDIARGNVATKAVNILGTHTSGIEVSGQINLKLIEFYGSYSYQNAKYADAAPGSIDRARLASVGIIAGTPVRDIPKSSAFAEVTLKPFAGLRLQANGRYDGSRVGGDIISPTFQEIGIEYVPGYVIFGASARYTFAKTGILQNASLQFNVDNVFNNAYIASVTSATATSTETGLPGRSLGRYFLGAPRTLTLSLRAKF